MAPSTELVIDGESYGDFAQLLRMVLQELSVRTELIEYVYCREMGPNGLEGYFNVTIKIPVIEVVPELHAITTCEEETSLTTTIGSVSCSAL